MGKKPKHKYYWGNIFRDLDSKEIERAIDIALDVLLKRLPKPDKDELVGCRKILEEKRQAELARFKAKEK